jgi:hypothetical protein
MFTLSAPPTLILLTLSETKKIQINRKIKKNQFPIEIEQLVEMVEKALA